MASAEVAAPHRTVACTTVPRSAACRTCIGECMKVDFDRERAWWDAKAPSEEQDLANEAINRALRWREIERHLAGVRTVLDVGAGTGAFSIPLAWRGFAVTHLDFSPAMLALTREKAEGLESVQFVEANAAALPFPDRSF